MLFLSSINFKFLKEQFSHASGKETEASKVYFRKFFFFSRHMAFCHNRGNRRIAPGKLR